MLKSDLKKLRRKETMTVCISALAKDKDEKFVIFATDHMITREELGEFETDFEKHYIFENNIIMMAGDVNYFEEIKKAFVSGKTCSEQAELIYKKLTEIRTREIERQILSRFNLNFKMFVDLVANGLDTSLVQFLQEEIVNFRFKVGLILSGFDGNEAKCFVISKLGISPETEIGYCSIGEGSMQAINTLMFTRQSPEKELKETLYNVVRARKNSDVAIGVGISTEIGVLDSKGRHKLFSKEEIKSLNEIYQKEKDLWLNESYLDKLVQGWKNGRETKKDSY